MNGRRRVRQEIAPPSVQLPPLASGIEGYAEFYSNIAIFPGEINESTTAFLLLLQAMTEQGSQAPCLIFDVATDLAKDLTQADSVRLLFMGLLAEGYPVYVQRTHASEGLTQIETKRTGELKHFDFQRILNIVEQRCRPVGRGTRRTRQINHLGLLPLRILTTTLSPQLDGTIEEISENSHMNILILDSNDRTIERFEPNVGGAIIYDSEMLDDELSKIVAPYGWTYIPPIRTCPNDLGDVHSILTPAMREFALGGYCVAHSLFYAALRILNPDLSREQILKYLNELGNAQRALMVLQFWTAGLRKLIEQHGRLPMIAKRQGQVEMIEDETGRWYVFRTPDGGSFRMSEENAIRAKLIDPEIVEPTPSPRPRPTPRQTPRSRVGTRTTKRRWKTELEKDLDWVP